MSLFLKLFDETQIPTPPEATRHHNLKKILIPLPLRADLLLSVHIHSFQEHIMPTKLLFTRLAYFQTLRICYRFQL